MSSQQPQEVDATLDLFDVHGESPDPPKPPTPTEQVPPTNLSLQSDCNGIEKLSQQSISDQKESVSITLTTEELEQKENNITNNNSDSNTISVDKNGNNTNHDDEESVSSTTTSKVSTSSYNTSTLSTSSLPFKASSIIRSISDKLPHQINSLGLKPKSIITPATSASTQSPLSSNTSSPQPPNTNNNAKKLNTKKYIYYIYIYNIQMPSLHRII